MVVAVIVIAMMLVIFMMLLFVILVIVHFCLFSSLLQLPSQRGWTGARDIAWYMYSHSCVVYEAKLL